MKKQLPIAGIANELSGASAFFPKQGSPSTQPSPPTHEDHVEPSRVVHRDPRAIPQPENFAQPSNPKSAQEQQESPNDLPHDQAIVQPSNHDTMPPRHQAAVIPSLMEAIRKVVKQVGKEAATHRFTAEEKRKLAEIVYTYERQGYRTSENEITRIAVNWLLFDYDEHGANSVLARLLDSLHR